MKNKEYFGYGILLIIVLIVTVIVTYSFQINNEWTITQYGFDDLSQMMAFSVEGNRNGLVIIDGGYETSQPEIENIKKIIEKHDNKVDAWILTHTDADHIGVFLYIYENCPEIEIKEIYTQGKVPMELGVVDSDNQNDINAFKRFSEIEDSRIHYLKEGDKIDLIGLDFNVLWSYDEWVEENTNRKINNGSLVFKLEGKENDFLFCSDVQDKRIGEQLIETYKDELKSDYIQVGHHGNNNFSEEFYKQVNPKEAIFCAPDWIMKNTKNVSWFTAPKIKEFLEKNGVKVLYDETSPNEWRIK